MAPADATGEAGDLLTRLEVPRDKRGNETQRVSQRLGPTGLDHGLELRASAPSRFGWNRASRAELLARRVSSITDSTPFPNRFLACDAISRFSCARKRKVRGIASLSCCNFAAAQAPAGGEV
jgi:hypothetical protein